MNGQMTPSGHNWVAGQGSGPRLAGEKVRFILTYFPRFWIQIANHVRLYRKKRINSMRWAIRLREARRRRSLLHPSSGRRRRTAWPGGSVVRRSSATRTNNRIAPLLCVFSFLLSEKMGFGFLLGVVGNCVCFFLFSGFFFGWFAMRCDIEKWFLCVNISNDLFVSIDR